MTWPSERQQSAWSIRVATDAGKAPAKVQRAVTRASKKARDDAAQIKAKRRRAAA
jgi:hypothetical protein